MAADENNGSGTPRAKKLVIKLRHRTALLDALAGLT
jgi:hypothetical protein